MKNKIILCFVDYYLPGYKAGGPIRSIANLVEHLGNEFEFRIICKDRDMLDIKSYANVNIDTWNAVGKAKVYYASKKTLTFKGIKKILDETEYDLLYLNSFFSYKFTIIPLSLIKMRLVQKKPCIIAPRGNFAIEAFKLKRVKKKIYLELAKYLNLYQGLNWQASSHYEKKDIIRELSGTAQQIFVAPDLTAFMADNNCNFKLRSPGSLRLLFLSRISPMKNLDFLLKVLTEVIVSVELSIFGPIEDLIYWKKCLKLIDKLPSNIKIIIGDEVPYKEVVNIFKKHDLFVLPTRGENFGHIIIESLSTGLPALISDKTPWQSNHGDGLKIIPLDKNKWVLFIDNFSKLDDKSLIKTRSDAVNYALNYNMKDSPVTKNKDFFNFVLKIGK